MTHTALLDLPDMLERMGINVLVADKWEQGQLWNGQPYQWTNPHTEVRSFDEHPFAYLVHHTAGEAANPPPADISKANAWTGLLRNGRLYQEGGGTPTIYLASAGPTTIGSGYGYRPAAWDHTFRGIRAPAHAQGMDTSTALNRYAFDNETVHRGDGSSLDPAVKEIVVAVGVALEEMFGLREMTLGHTSWTQRKIDPYWNGSSECIVQIQDLVKQGVENDMTWADIVQDATWQKAWDDGFIEGNPDVMPDYYFAGGPATEDEKKNAYNVIMREQMERT